MVRILVCVFLISTSTLAWAEQHKAPLSPEDQKILDEDQKMGGNYSASDLLGAIGFGLGHVAQDRWRERGWIFTAGETLTLGFAVNDLIKCGTNNSRTPDPSCSQAAWFGAGFLGFKIWEVIDLAVAADAHDRRLEELKSWGYRSSRFKAMLIPEQNHLRLGMICDFRF
jgi:hypothetical protein